MIGPEGQNLIFIISQPRAGSTMLQRMLGSHPEVYTVQEPWIMLDIADSLKRGGAAAGVRGAELFVGAFLETLPGREEDHVVGLRQLAAYLYDQALIGTEKRFFVDKSPPYYRIIPQLKLLFPSAQYILLLRNPLAVLCSILSSWVGEHWFMLHGFCDDLLLAPKLLIDGRKFLGDRLYLIHFEQLVRQPEADIGALCRWLGLPYSPSMVEYGRQDLPRWPWADQKSVYEHDRPVLEQAFRWHDQLSDPQVWRLAEEYLEALGRPVISSMGYDYDKQLALLDEKWPANRRWTFSLDWLAAGPPDERGPWDWWRLRAGRTLRKRGILGTLRHALVWK